MQCLYTEDIIGNNKIIFYDKSKNFVIKTYKKKNDEYNQDIFNETIMSKNKIIFIILIL